MVSHYWSTLALVSCLLSRAARSFSPPTHRPFGAPRTALDATATTAETTALGKLASMTTISIDSSDLDLVSKYATTGDVTDAATNPFFVWQAASTGDARYERMVERAVTYAKEETMGPYQFNDPKPVVDLAVDRLAVELGAELSKLVPRRVSTEVDVRLCRDADASVARARKIVDMYEELGVDRSRVLIEVAGTWEGIQAARVLEKEDGIRTKITLVFSFLQAAAAAQAGCHMVSPFPGRILDWHVAKSGREEGCVPDADPGVLTTKRIYSYLRHYGYDTICAPASWRPSSPSGTNLDEILALAGVDEMNIPPSLLEQLMESDVEVKRRCDPKADAAVCIDPDFKLTKETWDVYWGTDRCARDKLQEGIDAFTEDAERLAEIIIDRFN